MNTTPPVSETPAATSPAAPERPPLRVRFWRGAASALIGLTALVFIVLAALSVMIGRLSPVDGFIGDRTWAKILVGAIIVLLAVLPFVVLRRMRQRGRLTGGVLATLCAACFGALAWLGWDESALDHPLTLEEIAPAFPGSEKSFEVMMRYSKRTPSAEAKAFEALTLRGVIEGGPRDPEKWIEFVKKRRAEFEADWETLAPQRRWLAELNAFDRFADLTPARLDANLPQFKVWRALSQRACVVATLQSLDGKGDEAIATLAPMLEAGRKMHAHSRTLVRSMIAVVIERMCLETALIILDHPGVSAEGRRRLTAALATGNPNNAQLARRLILVEYVQFLGLISSMSLGDFAYAEKEDGAPAIVQVSLNVLGRLVMNPNATANLYGDHFQKLAALAETRQLDQFKTAQDEFMARLLPAVGVKNVAGRMILSMAIPAYQKVLDAFWATADTRAKLEQRLRTN